MSRQHMVYVLTCQPPEEFKAPDGTSLSPKIKFINFEERGHYKSIFNLLPLKLADAINHRIIVRSFSSTANQTLLRSYLTLNNLLRQVKFDIIYYEGLEALGLFRDIIHRSLPSAIHLYDAHNVDSVLWMQQAKTQRCQKLAGYAQAALSLEKTLHKKVNAYFCCSEEDNILLSELNGNNLTGTVIPNGVDIQERPFDDSKDKHLNRELLFCGSLDYLPNREGLLWFYREVLPLVKDAMPTIKLNVIGNLLETSAYQNLIEDPAVNFLGRVESVVPFYQTAGVSIAPLLSGSGTRLKILEAMSMGNPVVSTTVGAEGIACTHGENLLIGDTPEKFAENILSLLREEIQFNFIRTQAYNLVKGKYDWQRIGFALRDTIKNLT
ncbi:glycosyltransferase involved in cell wall biosynthesis [Pontibacter ummariensis]|uniref:Glycosyltransferase involved in cell wall bisynthesis n=2 Tax=Pontibacter ummariensis TaxID=1610492 RepID=A0A239BLQ4_9BACT|nr:glycosyltransferase involved in cell wall biosynthesis [Pontibacter ummariensis]SNS08910.1 Glycosyltransferase involved in cell wall bisynthesis [Pontibacter ummariensis]